MHRSEAYFRQQSEFGVSPDSSNKEWPARKIWTWESLASSFIHLESVPKCHETFIFGKYILYVLGDSIQTKIRVA